MAGDGAHRLMSDPHPTGAGARYCLAINSPVKSLLSHKLELDKDLISYVPRQVYYIDTTNDILNNAIHCLLYLTSMVGA